MKDLIIFGASGFGREVAWLVERINAKQPTWNLLGFMDDNEETRRMVEHCFRKKRTTVNPIVDWGDDDVWEFLNDVAKVPHCCLYDEGFTRLGCIGCPLQGREGMIRDFERWPRYKELYIRAFEKMIANHPGEIRVASGAPVPEEGGVQQYTQDGSLGMPDGNNPVQETVNSGSAAERERGRSGGRGQPRRTSTSGSARAEEMASRLGDDGSSDCVDMVPLALIPPPNQSVQLVERSGTQIDSDHYWLTAPIRTASDMLMWCMTIHR